MKTRHIALLGFTTSSVLAIAIAGCSASDTTPKKVTPKSDAGTTGAGGASGTTTTGGAAGAGSPVGAGGMVMNPTSGAGGAPAACTPPDKTAKALIAADPPVLSDLEGVTPGAITAVSPGGGWYAFQDPEVGTTFVPVPGSWMAETPGHGGTGSALHAAGTGFVGVAGADGKIGATSTNWGAGTGFTLGGQIAGGTTGMTTQPTDLSTYTGISFYGKSSSMSDVKVELSTADTSADYCTCSAGALCWPYGTVVTKLAADWTLYTVKFTDLKQPTYVAAPVPFDPSTVLQINFLSNGPISPFDFWIDDITLTK